MIFFTLGNHLKSLLIVECYCRTFRHLSSLLNIEFIVIVKALLFATTSVIIFLDLIVVNIFLFQYQPT